ncbi:MAG: SIMPL domain-containing protein [Lentimicrobiaceae bacterium]|jgi:hypothetical protein|nr:SIMPL domain-containing protein [Lentimicrobiaceae bacterium]
MKKSKLWLGGFCIGLGILIGAFVLKQGVTSMQNTQRVVTVKGLSEKEVPADKVIWPIVFKEVNNDLIAIYNNIERNNARVLDFLQANGITKDEITVSAPDIQDLQADRYTNADHIRYRYNGSSVITVSSTNVENVRSLIPKIATLIKDGIAIVANRTYENPVRYDFTQLNEVKPTMIEEATKNARLTAEKFAKDSHSKIGKIKSASQGQMSIESRDDNSPHIKVLRVVTTVTYYLKD